MRLICSALLAGAVLLAGPAGIAKTRHAKTSKGVTALGTPACLFDRDREALDIEGLKSQLMVTAVQCGDQAHSNYNAFMSRYHPEVANAESVLHAYFTRSYGRTGDKAYDEYMTQLAQNQEQVGLKAGTAYCENLDVMFDEVMSLHGGSELHDFTNAKMLYQPINFETCTGAPPALPTTRKTRHSSKSAKHA